MARSRCWARRSASSVPRRRRLGPPCHQPGGIRRGAKRLATDRLRRLGPASGSRAPPPALRPGRGPGRRLRAAAGGAAVHGGFRRHAGAGRRHAAAFARRSRGSNDDDTTACDGRQRECRSDPRPGRALAEAGGRSALHGRRSADRRCGGQRGAGLGGLGVPFQIAANTGRTTSATGCAQGFGPRGRPLDRGPTGRTTLSGRRHPSRRRPHLPDHARPPAPTGLG